MSWTIQTATLLVGHWERQNSAVIAAAATLSVTLSWSTQPWTDGGEQVFVKWQHPMMHDGVYPFNMTSLILICKPVYLCIVYSLTSKRLYFSFFFSFFLTSFIHFLLLFPPPFLLFLSSPSLLAPFSFTLFPPCLPPVYSSPPFSDTVFVVVDVDFIEHFNKK